MTPQPTTPETVRSLLELWMGRHMDVTVKCHPDWPGPMAFCEWCSEQHPCPDYLDALEAMRLLDESAETQVRVETPSGFLLYKPARIVSDWTPGRHEPAAHGCPDASPARLQDSGGADA